MTTPLDILAQQEARDVKWKALADAAHPGPYHHDNEGGIVFATLDVRIADIRGYGYYTGKGVGGLGLSEDEALRRMNATGEFLAESRTAIPQLLSDLARARAAIKCLVEQRDEVVRALATHLSEPGGQPPDMVAAHVDGWFDRDNAALLAILRGET